MDSSSVLADSGRWVDRVREEMDLMALAVRFCLRMEVMRCIVTKVGCMNWTGREELSFAR